MGEQEMTDEQFEALVEALSDPRKALDALPRAEREEYDRCIQSVVDARRAGERMAHELWIG